MYKSLTVRGLRGLADLELQRLQRINVFTGANGSGKTTVLEAFELHAQPMSGNAIIQLVQLRGSVVFFGPPSNQQSVVWRSLFNAGSPDQLIWIEGVTEADSWSVTMRPQSVTAPVLPQQGPVFAQSQALPPTPVASLEIACNREAGVSLGTLSILTNGQYTFEGSSQSEAPTVNALVSGQIYRNQQLLASEYSVAVQENDTELILESLRAVYPRIRDIRILSTGVIPSLFAELDDDSILELGNVSDGLVRMVSLILGIRKCRNGIFLVDEIEHGLHYSVHEKLWQVIDRASRAYNTQVFATSHSRECILAMSNALRGTGDVALHRMSVDDVTNRIDVKTFDADLVRFSLEEGLEVR